jgi:hypothetical protein
MKFLHSYTGSDRHTNQQAKYELTFLLNHLKARKPSGLGNLARFKVNM